MTQLRHPNIMRCTGVVTASKPYMVIMELATGGTLQSYLIDHGVNVSLSMKEHLARDSSI